MIEKSVILTNPKGIHARPSALILKTAQQYNASIQLIKDGEVADAGDIMSVLALGAMHGDTLLLRADGPDENEAIEHLLEIFDRKVDDHE
jgi:phosphocarrier protein HPr